MTEEDYSRKSSGEEAMRIKSPESNVQSVSLETMDTINLQTTVRDGVSTKYETTGYS